MTKEGREETDAAGAVARLLMISGQLHGLADTALIINGERANIMPQAGLYSFSEAIRREALILLGVLMDKDAEQPQEDLE